MGAAPPLPTLRDLLELACESSCSEGFRSYPRRPLPCRDNREDDAVKAKAEAPVRLLIDADLRRSPSRTLSSILFPRSPGSLATVSRLTRSLSRRLVFWRRHIGDDDEGRDADERDSFAFPSPVVSSCSASECAESALLMDADESEKPSTSTSSASAGSVDDAHDGAAAAGGGHKAVDGDPAVGSGVESVEDKQQLSPVSVMDFPFQDDDDRDELSDAGTCSPSFQQRQHDLERSNSAHEPLHKIRRLDGLAQAAVDPVDLDPRLFIASEESGVSASDDTHTHCSDSSTTDQSAETTSTQLSDERQRSTDDLERQPDAHRRLLAQLLNDDDKAVISAAAERLLLDFFADGLGSLRSLLAGPVIGAVKQSDGSHESALVHAAKQWVQGAGTQWGVEDVLFSGEAALSDVDRERRWMCVGEEEREVGVAVEWLVLDALVAELVSDLAVVRC